MSVLYKQCHCVIMVLPEKVTVEINELKLESSSILTVLGSTRSGKSTKIAEILLNSEKCFQTPPAHWFIIYKFWDKSYESIKNATFIKGWRDDLLEELELTSRQQTDSPLGLVIDDCCEDIAQSKKALQLFSGQIHHLNLFLIFVSQHLFMNNNIFRLCLRQSQYLLLFHSPRQRQAIRTLSQQLFVKPNFLNDVLESAGAYNPVLIDLLPTTNTVLQCRSGPWVDLCEYFIYVPKST